MTEERYGKFTLKLYEDIDELPAKNFFTLNEYSLLAAEIGSSFNDVNVKFQKFHLLMAEGKMDEAVQEAKNLHQTFWNIHNKIHFPSLQKCCFIHSINGVRLTDLSQFNLNKIIKKISPYITIGQIENTTSELKKK